MDLILNSLRISSLCIDYNPIMDCNAFDLIMWLLAAIFQNSILYIYVIIQLLCYIKYFLFNFIHIFSFNTNFIYLAS